MPNQNLISVKIPNPVINTMEENLRATIEAFKPFAVTLTTTQRKELFKMGDKSTDLATKLNGYLSSIPEFIPNYVKKEEFDQDFAIPQVLRTALALSQQLNDLIDDTIMAAGSDIMDVGMSYYNNVRSAAHDGAPGAKAIYEDLKTRFASKASREAAAGSNTKTD